MPGPPRKPTALRVLEGNPSKRALPKGEPKPAPYIPSPPSFLSKTAKSEWKRIARELNSLGLLSRVDRVALAGYCETYAKWKAAELAIQEHGLFEVTTNGNTIQHPAVGVANKCLVILRGYIQEFGLSPAARSKISVTPDKEENEFASLLAQAQERRRR